MVEVAQQFQPRELEMLCPDLGLATAAGRARIQFDLLKIVGGGPMLDISRDIHSLTDFKKIHPNLLSS